jgi:hypothetical protein
MILLALPCASFGQDCAQNCERQKNFSLTICSLAMMGRGFARGGDERG